MLFKQWKLRERGRQIWIAAVKFCIIQIIDIILKHKLRFWEFYYVSYRIRDTTKAQANQVMNLQKSVDILRFNYMV